MLDAKIAAYLSGRQPDDWRQTRESSRVGEKQVPVGKLANIASAFDMLNRDATFTGLQEAPVPAQEG